MFTAPPGDKKLVLANALMRLVSLRRYSLVDHTTWWFIHRRIGTPLFDQLLEMVRQAKRKRALTLPRNLK
tara:strand:- start:34521 stop:34730 length:210 start_codon:yes stop_codon:yes gene_type:complete